MKNKIKAFTLVELVIVIAIVVILSLVSVPIYNDYAWKSKRTEGYTLLATIRDAQLQYYNEYGNFIGQTWTCYSEVLAVDARPNTYYTWFICHNKDGKTKENTWIWVSGANGAGNITLLYNLTSGGTYS